MEEVRDSIYYPRPFKYFIVTSKDGNNDPLITKFFTKKTNGIEVFRWTQTWFADGKLESCFVEIAGEDYNV